MEKARLSVFKNKKDTFVVKAVFSDSGKEMPVQRLDYHDVLSLDGKEVEIEKAGGQITKIMYNGAVIFSKPQIPSVAYAQEPAKQHLSMSEAGSSEKAVQKIEHFKGIKYPAWAPYNFVPLNDRVVEAEPVPDFNMYHHARHTGYIELAIETRTPLYIRDTLTEEEMRKKEENERDKTKKYINPDFFSPGGKKRIPGSSLRGMIRTMVEMVSFGRFGFFEKERKYHFRSFADKSLDLREQYSQTMLCGDATNGFQQRVKAGYLIKRGFDYYIIPSKVISETQFFRIEEDDAIKGGVIKERMKIIDYYSCKDHKDIKTKTNGKCHKCSKDLIPIYKENKNYETGYKFIKFTYQKPQKHTNHSKPLYYAKATGIWDENDTNALVEAIDGALVLSNWMRGQRGKEGKHLHWVIGPEDSSKQLKFLPGVIEDFKEDFKNDVGRHEDGNLLKYFKDNQKAKVPCFYIEENGLVKSFGHTGLFRLAYQRELKDFLTGGMTNFNGIDLADAIFGKQSSKENDEAFASRVFFEDAFLEKDQKNVLMGIDTPKILSNPKPTTFQHYLEQDEGKISFDIRGNIKGLKTYNDKTLLRGNKLYWHKDGNDWIETNKENIEKHQTQYTKINPIRTGIIFSGIIRFENLSDVELGALLFSLELPPYCCHKLGMGKPLGLGSVQITPKLFLSDRKTRYKELFAEWEQPIPESTSENKDISHFKKTFAEYILKGIGKDTGADPINTLWEVDRMKELKTMLDFKKKPDDKKPRYMELGEFKERKVLPLPTEVVQ